MPPKAFTLSFLGDVQLGRLIDQLMPTHVDCPSEARIVSTFVRAHPHLREYGPKSPWGTTLPLLLKSDLRLINLETSMTTHGVKWPDKVFNYRCHPANIEFLKAAKIDYAGLANNHTLDFCEEGLRETVETVKGAGIKYAGAVIKGEDRGRPAILELPGGHRVYVYSAADHPSDWAKVPEFNLIDYSVNTRRRLKAQLAQTGPQVPSLKIFSVHWGPNYRWSASQEIQDLAHFLIDECGVDIIHGHSSHHIQGIEVYKGKPIIWGSGDYVDDYALVADYRNDLSAVWNVVVEEEDQDRLKPIRVEVFPSRIKHFQAMLLDQTEEDHVWVRDKLSELSAEFDVRFTKDAGQEGQLMVDLH